MDRRYFTFFREKIIFETSCRDWTRPDHVNVWKERRRGTTPKFHPSLSSASTDCGSIIFDSQFVVPYSRHRYNMAQPRLIRYDGDMIGCLEFLM